MDQVIRELCGTEYARDFWPRWYRRHLGRRDLEAMAQLGYNSVRLVLNGAALLREEPGIRWNEDTFAVLDQVLDWCEELRLYAILDLHAAPGGQSCGQQRRGHGPYSAEQPGFRRQFRPAEVHEPHTDRNQGEQKQPFPHTGPGFSALRAPFDFFPAHGVPPCAVS